MAANAITCSQFSDRLTSTPKSQRISSRWTGTRATILPDRAVSESVRKDHAGLHSFLSMRRIEARRKKARPLRLRFSQSLASLRHRLSQANLRAQRRRALRSSVSSTTAASNSTPTSSREVSDLLFSIARMHYSRATIRERRIGRASRRSSKPA